MSNNTNAGTVDVIIQDGTVTLDTLYAQNARIEQKMTEFVDLATKIYGFVEQMKGNPMLSAMLGGIK